MYSVGHSNQSEEAFLALVKDCGVDCIVDVRSVPASKYAPQFNQSVLKGFLEAHGVRYLHFGEEFGARRSDSLDASGQVNFELAAQTPSFAAGVERVMRGMERGYSIAFMCSEADPLECHRFALVSRHFHEMGVEVKHILKESRLVSHGDLEREMIAGYMKSKKHHLKEVDMMFGTYTADEQRRDAYRLKNKEIGYKPEDKNIELDRI